MRGWSIGLLLSTLTVSAPCFAATKNFTVQATQGWLSTGITVNTKQYFGIWQKSGSWTVDKNNFGNVDAAGYPPQIDQTIFQGCKYNGSWPYGLLLGKVGTNVFPIGRGGSFLSSQSGVLQLGINDQSSCLGDNAGALSVSVGLGLNVQGVLSKVTASQIDNLTTAERARLLLYAKNSSACAAAKGNILSQDCAATILALISFVVAPEQVQ